MLPSTMRLASLTTALFIFGACSTSGPVRAAVKPEKDRKKAPEFSLKDPNGQSVKLADYKGKVVLLNFWATWCGPCRLEIPWFAEFEQKYKDKGFAVLGVAMDDEGWEVVKPYLEKMKMNYRVLLGNDTVATLYGGVDSLPTSFMIDREGRIAAIHIGLVSKGDYQNDLNTLLGLPKADGKRGATRAMLPALVLGTD
ncbi:MAG: redoxin domain-containing protein [Bryobacteraceae bacterium]